MRSLRFLTLSLALSLVGSFAHAAPKPKAMGVLPRQAEYTSKVRAPELAARIGKPAVASRVGGAASRGLIFDERGPFGSHVQSYVNDAEIILTVGVDGDFLLAYYANPYLGYVNIGNGDLLNCTLHGVDGYISSGNYESYTVSASDCFTVGNLSDISSFAQYPNGQAIRNGSTFYYENGAVFTDSNSRYFYPFADTFTGFSAELRDGSTYYYSNGEEVVDFSRIYYQNGSTLYNSGTLYNRSGSTFHSSSSDPRYLGFGRDIRDESGNTVELFAPSGTVLADFNTSTGVGVLRHFPNTSQVMKRSFDKSNSEFFFSNGVSTTDPVVWLAETSGVILAARANTYDDQFYAIQGDIDDLYTYVHYREQIVPPSNPSGLATTLVKARTVNVAWNGSSSSRIAMQPGTVPPASCANGTNVSGNSHSFTGLTPDTDYSVRLCALGGNGGISRGVVLTFRTAQEIPPAAPVIVSSSKNDEFITLNWTAGVGGGFTEGYRVNYQEGGTPPALCGNDVGLQTSYTTPFSLEPSTTYSFTVCAYNEGGQLSAPAHISVTTDVLLPPPMPSFGEVSKLSGTRATLNFSSGGGSTRSLQLALHEGTVAPTDCSGGVLSLTLQASAKSQATHPAVKLNPLTEYTAVLCAFNRKGVPAAAPAYYNFSTTDLVVAPPVTDLVATPGSLNTILLNWKSGGEFTESYKVAVVAGESTPNDCSEGVDVSSPQHSFNVDVNFANTYSYMVCAVSVDGVVSPGVTGSTSSKLAVVQLLTRKKNRLTYQMTRNFVGEVSRYILTVCDNTSGICRDKKLNFSKRSKLKKFTLSVRKGRTLTLKAQAPLQLLAPDTVNSI